MKAALQRLLFVLLSTAVMVFFSEKAYWYPQGYAIFELILFYGVPVYAIMWAVDYFKVSRFSSVVLIAGVYAFLIEGVLTPVIFEAGLLDPIMPAYFIGWHGLLSVIFGWYFIRKWLVAGQWGRLAFWSAVFGIFWGFNSITFWLPENFEGYEFPGQWPTEAYATHAFVFAGMLMLAHLLLGLGGWVTGFELSRIEKWGVGALLLFFYSTLSFLAVPFGFLKLAVLLSMAFVPLYIRHRRGAADSILVELSGPIRPLHLTGILCMPLGATLVYGAAVVLDPTDEFIRAVLELQTISQSLLGIGLFIWAIIKTVRGSKRGISTPQSTVVTSKMEG